MIFEDSPPSPRLRGTHPRALEFEGEHRRCEPSIKKYPLLGGVRGGVSPLPPEGYPQNPHAMSTYNRGIFAVSRRWGIFDECPLP